MKFSQLCRISGSHIVVMKSSIFCDVTLLNNDPYIINYMRHKCFNPLSADWLNLYGSGTYDVFTNEVKYWKVWAQHLFQMLYLQIWIHLWQWQEPISMHATSRKLLGMQNCTSEKYFDTNCNSITNKIVFSKYYSFLLHLNMQP
jgi:hypothetical protein